MEEGGFLYDSDVYNDDIPYFVEREKKKLLLIPYTPDINDFHYFSNRFSHSDDFYAYLKDSFDVFRRRRKEESEDDERGNTCAHQRPPGKDPCAGKIPQIRPDKERCVDCTQDGHCKLVDR